MLNLNEILTYKLKLGANQLNVVELLADRLILAEALNKAMHALAYCSNPPNHSEANSAQAVAYNAIGEIGQAIDFKGSVPADFNQKAGD